MGKISALLLSSLAAVAVQPLVFFGYMGIPSLLSTGYDPALLDLIRISFMPAIVAVPFVLLVGIPSILLLARYSKLRWWPLGLIGFCAASFPVAVLGPGGSPNFSSGGSFHGKSVDFIVNGEATMYGWLNYLESIFLFGLHGLIGASMFLFVWRRCTGPNNSFKPKPLGDSA